MWMVHIPRASEKLQDAVFSILRTIALTMPPDIKLPMGICRGRSLSSADVNRWLQDTGSEELWTNKKVYLACPSLLAPTVEASWCMWFMCRYWGKSEQVLNACVSFVGSIASVLDASIAKRAHRHLPTMRLPAVTSEAYAQARKALRGGRQDLPRLQHLPLSWHWVWRRGRPCAAHLCLRQQVVQLPPFCHSVPGRSILRKGQSDTVSEDGEALWCGW